MKPPIIKLSLSLILVASLLSAISIRSPNVSANLSTAKPKYNVLFLISDDLRPVLGCYGNPIIRTPNVDGLAARGTRFDRAYAQFPLCNPSRSSMLNGRYPTQTGVMDNNTYFRAKHPDYVTLPQYFQKNGYATLRTGKIFHGGIDDQVSWTEGGEPVDPNIVNRPPSPVATGQGARETGDEEAMPQPNRPARPSASDRIVVLDGDGESHGDYKIATRAIEFLDRYKDKPFFLAVGFNKPHSPPTAPKKFFDLYDPEKIPLPVDFNIQPRAPAGFPDISIPHRNADLFIGRDSPPAEAREMIRAYYASTSFMDAQVGRVLAELDRLKLRDNTIIVFWGDHGYHLGEKGKWSKAYSLWDVGLRVPLIIDMPGGKPQTSERVVELLDLYRTLADLCGLPPPAGIEGRSIAPLLRNPNLRWSYPAFAVVQFQGKFGESVRTERWHYVEWDEGRAGSMLLDGVSDPRELQNLASEPSRAATVQEMKGLLKKLPQPAK
ncbi:MAG TPA: sulfatase [Pyrinomonadaceae bacterium]|nr:sulfatase [Pyrinomonadaceae bacterium]